eukprot:gene21554-28547_t
MAPSLTAHLGQLKPGSTGRVTGPWGAGCGEVAFLAGAVPSGRRA